MSKTTDQFVPLNIAVLTVSDTRSIDTDTSGQALVDALQNDGHSLRDRAIVIDDIYQIRFALSKWICDSDTHVVLITGGTGFAGRDSTPEAALPLFDKEIPGFGELFRAISYDEIGCSTIQSRAMAGLANGTLIFCLPGSTGACKTGWNKIIQNQLDARSRPCNFVAQLIS